MEGPGSGPGRSGHQVWSWASRTFIFSGMEISFQVTKSWHLHSLSRPWVLVFVSAPSSFRDPWRRALHTEVMGKWWPLRGHWGAGGYTGHGIPFCTSDMLFAHLISPRARTLLCEHMNVSAVCWCMQACAMHVAIPARLISKFTSEFTGRPGTCLWTPVSCCGVYPCPCQTSLQLS